MAACDKFSESAGIAPDIVCSSKCNKVKSKEYSYVPMLRWVRSDVLNTILFHMFK